MANIYIVITKNSLSFPYTRFDNDSPIPRLLKIKNKQPFDLCGWGTDENEYVPSEIEKSIKYKVMLAEMGSFKNVVFLTHNIFAISYLDTLIKCNVMKKSKVRVYYYNGKTMEKQRSKKGIKLPPSLVKEYKRRVNLISKKMF